MAAKSLSDLRQHLLDRAAEITGIKSSAMLYVYEQIPGVEYPRLEIFPDIPGSSIDGHSITREGAWETYNLIISVSDNRTTLSTTDSDFVQYTALKRLLHAFLYKAFHPPYMADFTLLSAQKVPVSLIPHTKNSDRIEVQAKIQVRVFVGDSSAFEGV